jgi:hypothetical protein
LVVHAGDRIGERTLEGGSCDDLAGAAAVNLALLLKLEDSIRPSEAGGSSAPPAEPSLPQPSAARAPPTLVDQNRARSEEDAEAPLRWDWLLRVPVASLAFVLTPIPSFGVASGVWLEGWVLVAGAKLWLPQALELEDRPTVGARIERIDANVQACRGFPFGRVELAPCATISLEHVRAHGTGSNVRAKTATSTWVSAGAGMTLRWGLHEWLGVFGAIQARFHGARPRLSIEGIGRIGQLGPVAIELSVGPELIL